MLYVDTSLLVAALSSEPMTRLAQQWLAGQEATQLAVSHWTMTELSSALSIKVRRQEIDLEHRANALAVFNELVADSFTLFAVSRDHFRTAAKFADQHRLGLRSGDALHLAIASEHGATVYTLDLRLAEAGPPLGVPTRLLE